MKKDLSFLLEELHSIKIQINFNSSSLSVNIEEFSMSSPGFQGQNFPIQIYNFQLALKVLLWQ